MGEARSADEDRGLLRSNTECITIRMKGDDNADKNSVLLEDLTEGRTIEEKRAGTLPQGIWDSDCLEAPDGNLLKLTIESPSGYSSTGFHAVFIGTFRLIRVAGGEKNDVDVRCFRLTANQPFVEEANCDEAPSQESSSSGSTSGGSSSGPPVQQASTLPFTSRMGCDSGEKKVQVTFEKDSYNENKWWIENKNTNQKVLECDGNGDYCESEVVDACLEADDYQVVMQDAIGDGCPKFELRMEKSGGGWSHPLIARCYNGKEWKRHFHTKPSRMTPREVDWLDAHNERRYVFTLVLVCFQSMFNRLINIPTSLSLKFVGKNITTMEIESSRTEMTTTFPKSGILDSLKWHRYTPTSYSTIVKATK